MNKSTDTIIVKEISVKEISVKEISVKEISVKEIIVNYKFPITLTLLLLFLFLPTLVFPLSSDLSIFMMMGDYILDGRTIYQNFIDIKPPFLYYIFAFSNLFLGNSELSIRLFIILYQLATIYFLYNSINLIFKNRLLSSIISILFVIYFVSLGFDFSIIPETLLFLPFCIVLYLLINKPLKYSNLLLSGLLIGLTTGLKFTFGILLIPYLFSIRVEIQKQNHSHKSLVLYLQIFIGFFIGLSISLASLLDIDILNNYLVTFQYLKLYTNEGAINFDFLVLIIKRFFENIIKKISVVYFVLALLGLPYIYSKIFITDRISNNKNENNLELNKTIITYSVLSFLLLTFSVVVERKLTLLHFVRTSIPLFILIASAIFQLYYFKFQNQKYNSNIVILLISVIFILGTPFPRYAKQLFINYGYYFNKDVYYSIYQEKTNPLAQHRDYKLVTNYIIDNFSDCSVIVSGIGDNIINYNLYRSKKNYTLTTFSQSCFYNSKNEIPLYKQMFLNEIKSADILIVDNRDNHYEINFHKNTTLEMMQKRFANEFQNFKKIKEIGQFNIFLRIK